MTDQTPVTVLIIEDDANDIEFLTAVLPRRIAELAGAKFESVLVNGIANTELINARIRGLGTRLRLVICDGLGGQIETVIRVIRGSFPKLAIIAASSDQSYLALGMEAGASVAIDKMDLYTVKTRTYNIVQHLLAASV